LEFLDSFFVNTLHFHCTPHSFQPQPVGFGTGTQPRKPVQCCVLQEILDFSSFLKKKMLKNLFFAALRQPVAGCTVGTVFPTLCTVPEFLTTYYRKHRTGRFGKLESFYELRAHARDEKFTSRTLENRNYGY
jgi:hypothetical protein